MKTNYRDSSEADKLQKIIDESATEVTSFMTITCATYVLYRDLNPYTLALLRRITDS